MQQKCTELSAELAEKDDALVTAAAVARENDNLKKVLETAEAALEEAEAQRDAAAAFEQKSSKSNEELLERLLAEQRERKSREPTRALAGEAAHVYICAHERRGVAEGGGRGRWARARAAAPTHPFGWHRARWWRRSCPQPYH